MRRSSRKCDRERRRRQHTQLKAQHDDLQKKGIYFKRVLRHRGIVLPFYDFYDSYFSEFSKVVAQAKIQFPSLLDIVELDDREYFATERGRFAPGLEQIFWDNTGQECADYGANSDGSNINGYTTAFRAGDGSLRTLVTIRKSVPNVHPHREHKYVFKLIALLHELGHVHDMEWQINFNSAASTFDTIEAEVFAHLYALGRMAERNYYQCYAMLIDGLKTHTEGEGYVKEVARLTLARVPHYELVDVSNVSFADLTPADLEALGPDGRRAFGITS